jgi:hypothetical protein
MRPSRPCSLILLYLVATTMLAACSRTPNRNPEISSAILAGHLIDDDLKGATEKVIRDALSLAHIDEKVAINSP